MPRAPVVYAAAPMPMPVPVAYDTAYHLDAGDRLRVVVYGQEGLTNTYAIDAGGSITMPLIGAVPARGRTPARLAADITAKLRNGFIREPSVAVEIEAYRPFFILGEVAAPGQYPYVPNMIGRKRGGDCRRLLAARPPRPRHAHPYRCIGIDARRWCRSARPSAPAIPCWSANAGSRIRPGRFQRDLHAYWNALFSNHALEAMFNATPASRRTTVARPVSPSSIRPSNQEKEPDEALLA